MYTLIYETDIGMNDEPKKLHDNTGHARRKDNFLMNRREKRDKNYFPIPHLFSYMY